MPVASHYTFVAEFKSNSTSEWMILFDQDLDIKACKCNGYNVRITPWREDIIFRMAEKRCDLAQLVGEASHYEDGEECQDDDDIDFINSTIPYYD